MRLTLKIQAETVDYARTLALIQRIPIRCALPLSEPDSSIQQIIHNFEPLLLVIPQNCSGPTSKLRFISTVHQHQTSNLPLLFFPIATVHKFVKVISPRERNTGTIPGKMQNQSRNSNPPVKIVARTRTHSGTRFDPISPLVYPPDPTVELLHHRIIKFRRKHRESCPRVDDHSSAAVSIHSSEHRRSRNIPFADGDSSEGNRVEVRMLGVIKQLRVHELDLLFLIIINNTFLFLVLVDEASEDERTRASDSLRVERVRDEAVGEAVTEARRERGELRGEREASASEAGDADGLGESGVSAAEGEVSEGEGREGEGVGEEAADEGAVAVGVVERRARVG